MDNVRMTREKLLSIVSDNRIKHKSEYDQASTVYKTEVLKGLKRLTRDAKKQSTPNKIVTSLHLPVPVSYVESYDKVISMLEHTIEPHIELTEHDFGCYVMDKWEWKGQFVGTTSVYNSMPSPRVPAKRGKNAK